MMSGYSGTPLAKKLGYRARSRVAALDAPTGYRASLDPLPDDVVFVDAIDASVDLVHVFTVSRARLADVLARCRTTLAPDAVVWASWPKKAARLATEVDEHVIRAVALPLGFVDIKVCAVDATWSALKLVVRTSLR